MPWKPEEAMKHTKAAKGAKAQRLWAKVANETLERTGDEGRAIREANAVVRKEKEKK